MNQASARLKKPEAYDWWPWPVIWGWEFKFVTAEKVGKITIYLNVKMKNLQMSNSKDGKSKTTKGDIIWTKLKYPECTSITLDH